MCTVMVLRNVFDDAPLVVAANRDERYARAAEGPSLRPGPVPLVAPRDLEAGGTWWAFGRGGLVVAITNRFGVPNLAGRASRGTLVEGAVRAGGFEGAVDYARGLDGAALNGFHLVVVQGERQAVFVGDGARCVDVSAGSGSLFVSERSFGADDLPRDAHVAALVGGLDRRFDASALVAVLARHDPGFLGPCIHADAIGYGTRSSLVWRADTGELLASEGPPCTHAMVDRTALLTALASA